MKKNILITGINGFLGTATAKHFLNQGHHIVGLVRDLNMKSQKDVQDKCSIVRGDILDKELVRSIFAKYEIDYVLHLAACPIVRICNNDPYTAYMTNIVGTLNVLEAARSLKRSPEKIICITSDKAFGPHSKLPYTEDSELVVSDSYCTSKACQDQISRSYANTYGLPIITVRAGNLYGAGDLNTSRLIPQTITRLLSGESPILYSGVADYVREFLYVTNVVAAFDILLQKGINGEPYNIGGTQPYKIRDVIEIIRDKINPEATIEIVQKDFFEIPQQYLDASKLETLGWKPQINLSDGLDKTIAWFRERQNACTIL
jgi:CDP-glucose 4,6-dehydratase